MWFQWLRGVGYPSSSRRACEAGFGEVWEVENDVSVHRTGAPDIRLCPVALSGGASWWRARVQRAPDIRRCHRTCPVPYVRWLTLSRPSAVFLPERHRTQEFCPVQGTGHVRWWFERFWTSLESTGQRLVSCPVLHRSLSGGQRVDRWHERDAHRTLSGASNCLSGAT